MEPLVIDTEEVSKKLINSIHNKQNDEAPVEISAGAFSGNEALIYHFVTIKGC